MSRHFPDPEDPNTPTARPARHHGAMDAALHLRLIRGLLELGRTAEADQEFRALVTAPVAESERKAVMETAAALASDYTETGQYRLALELFLAVPEALRRHPGLLSAGAAAALHTGDRARAEKLLAEALELAPARAESHLLLGEALSARDPQAAARAYRRYHDLNANLLGAKTYLKKMRELLRASGNVLALKETALAFAGNFTLEPVQAHAEAECLKAGVRASCYFAGFGQYFQEMADAQSGLYKHRPDFLFLLLDPRVLAPDLFGDFFAVPADERPRIADRHLQQLRTLAEKFLSQSSARLVIGNFVLPRQYLLGIHDMHESRGEREIVTRMNESLYEFARAHPGIIFVLDLEKVVSSRGKDAGGDKMRFLAKMEIPEAALPELGREIVRYVRPAAGLTRKCLVLDLDNTLWGGILGEDGIEGIRIGQDPPGNAFLEFQKIIRSLHHRGILLAVNSKNDWELVKEVFERHPDMLLRADDFACIRANWQDKARNMREIAAELNIGLDSLVYMDDNPAERFLVQRELPEVLTVEMPEDCADFAQTLLRLDAFEVLNITEEDRKRKHLYQAEAQRKELQKNVTDLGEYLEALHIRVDIRAADPFAVPRVSQLTQRTNQFNLTTRRYSESEVKAFVDSGQSAVYYLKSADRFGDHGITGVCIARANGASWELDTFLMSCRIIGRGIEQAFLHFVCTQAKQAGAGKLIGRYLPTRKNQLVAEFYPSAGFAPVSRSAEEAVFELDLARQTIPLPQHIRLNATD